MRSATRTCTKCSEVKDEDSFPRDSRRPNGRRPECRACARARKAKWLEALPGGVRVAEKKCSRCKRIKPASGFCPSKCHASGLRSECKSCVNSPDAALKRRLVVYGLSLGRFEDLLRSQGGLCPVCFIGFDSPSEMNIDHDHTCCPGYRSCGGCVRGILHGNCNQLIGKAREDCAILAAACEYLANWRVTTDDTL